MSLSFCAIAPTHRAYSLPGGFSLGIAVGILSLWYGARRLENWNRLTGGLIVLIKYPLIAYAVNNNGVFRTLDSQSGVDPGSLAIGYRGALVGASSFDRASGLAIFALRRSADAQPASARQ